MALVGAMSLSVLAGCGSSSSGSTGTASSNSASTEKQTTTGTTKSASTGTAAGGSTEFWNDKLANTDQSDIDQMMGTISDLSGVNVTCVAYPDTASYQTALQQSIGTTDAPGLFTWWSGSQLESLYKSGNLEDLSDIWDKYVIPSGISKDVKEALSFDGKPYAVPYSIIYNEVIYNKDIFDKYGLSEPQTFDDFLNVCETLKSNGVTPIALKNDSWAGFIWFEALLASYSPDLYQGICDGSIDYTDERVYEVMSKWQDMLDKGYFSDPMKITDMDKSLANGTVAMELEPNYECVNLTNDYGMVPEKDISAFVLPSMNGANRVVYFEIAPLCVAANSGSKDAAMKTLESWYSDEFQTKFTEVTGFLCSGNVKSDNATANKMVSYANDSTNYTMQLRYYENTSDAIRDVAVNELMKFETKAATADEILPTIQAKANEVFGK